MNKRSAPRRSLAGLAFLLALGLLLIFAVPALADYLGPDRTVSVWQWERLQCDYQAVYDPAGPGWYGCTLQLYASPDSGCPSTGSVVGFFNTDYCGDWPDDCGSLPCSISLSTSTVGCTEGEPGCTAVEHFATLPEATINGSVSCGVPGYSGWCLSTAALSLSGSEPLSGYSILALEGTRNGETFACPGDNCAVPISEGSSDFTYWAISSWGDTSRMGATTGRVDTQPPAISGSISGVAGDNGWYLSDVTFTVSASDASPGSGVSSLDLSLDGGGWSAYTGPLTISEGSHSLDVRAGDAAGNVSTESQVVRVDTQPPTLALSAGGSFCPGCGQTLEVTIDVQDSLSGVLGWSLSADGAPIGSGTGPTSQTLAWNGSGLPGGAHTLLLEARDAAGNTQDASQPVTLLAPPPPQASSTPSHPGSTPILATPTSTAAQAQLVTRTSRPTRTASVSGFGALPLAPADGSPAPDSALGPEGAPPTTGSSGVLWGVGALGLIGAATALALDAARKRKEEEERLRAQMEARNAAQRAKEEAERERLRAAAAATAADWVAERRAQEWQEEEIAARSARIDQAQEAREVRLAWEQEQAEEADKDVVGKNKAVHGKVDPQTTPTPLEGTATPTPSSTPSPSSVPTPSQYRTPVPDQSRMPDSNAPTESCSPLQDDEPREEQLMPLFWDSGAYRNGTLQAQLAVGAAPYTPLSGNPNDPALALEGVGPMWWLQLVRFAHRVLAPFANAEYQRTLQSNVDITVYYSSYIDGTFRMNGVALSNNSAERLMVGNVLVDGAEGSQVIYPLGQENVGGLLSVPPSAGPGETATVRFDNCDVEPVRGPEIEVQLYLTTGQNPYFSQWEVNWPGGPTQDHP